MKTWHVTPSNDIAEHIESIHCMCKPDIIHVENGNRVVVHNAFDARETPARILQKLIGKVPVN